MWQQEYIAGTVLAYLQAYIQRNYKSVEHAELGTLVKRSKSPACWKTTVTAVSLPSLRMIAPRLHMNKQ